MKELEKAKTSARGARGWVCGKQRSVKVYKNRCIVRADGLGSCFQEREETIYYADIVGIEFCLFSNGKGGFLRIIHIDKKSEQGRKNRETTVSFEESASERMEEIAAYIQRQTKIYQEYRRKIKKG